MYLRNDTAEFFAKAKELGLIDEIDQKLEERKHAQRLAVIAKIAELPPIEKTEIPAVAKAATAAHRALELAQEAFMAADREYKQMSLRLYGLQLQHDGARLTLEREAQKLAPTFLQSAYEDLSILDGHAQARFKYEIESVSGGGWFGGRSTQTTNNGAAIQACRDAIKGAQDRVQAMMLESTDPAAARIAVDKLLSTVEAQAFALGVDKQIFADRRKPVDVAQKIEDHANKERQKRSNAISNLRT
jgi:hypothetical protein